MAATEFHTMTCPDCKGFAKTGNPKNPWICMGCNGKGIVPRKPTKKGR